MEQTQSGWIEEILAKYVPPGTAFKTPLLEDTLKTYVDGVHIQQVRITRDVLTLPEKSILDAVFNEDKIAYGLLIGIAVPADRGWLLLINNNSILELTCGNSIRYFKLIDFDVVNGITTGFEEIDQPVSRAMPTEVIDSSEYNEIFDEELHKILGHPQLSDQIKLS